MKRVIMHTGRSTWEIGAVIATALLHPVFVDLLHRRAVFIMLALGGWVLYLGTRACRHRDVLEHWGFRRRELGPAFAATSAFALVALVVMVGIALGQHTLAFRWQMLPLLVLYPIWGTLQQLLVQGIFVRTMTADGCGVPRRFTTAAVASILFGAVHLPDLKLVAATGLLGAVFALI